MIEGDIIEIDGSFGEGGGSILRIGAGFSSLFSRAIRIKNIRANRPKPGLRMQHLMGLKTLAKLTNSNLSKCVVGSKEITLIPNTDIESNIDVKISTAGSIGLLLQPIQIASLGFRNSELIKINIQGGGSFGKWAPSLNYLQEVTYQQFRNSGLKIDVEIKKHGFYPKGGAQVICILHPLQNDIKPINLIELGNLDIINGEIIATNHLKNRNVGERIKKAIDQNIKKHLKIDLDVKIKYVDSLSSGVGLSLWSYSDRGAIISTGTILGEKNMSSEKLGNLAADEIINYILNEIPVDNYLSDQLIPLMAYARKPSRIKVQQITRHTLTNLELTKLFTQREYHITKEKNFSIIEYA
jgi:RNA 3'-phosphate cyclase